MLDLLSPLNFFKQSEHLKKNFLFRKWGPEKVGQAVEMEAEGVAPTQL